MKRNYSNINNVLNRILAKHNLSHIYSLESIKKNWASFDKTIAAHASPVAYDLALKKLVLKVDNTSWKKEFIQNKDILIVKIQNAFQSVDIKKLEIV